MMDAPKSMQKMARVFKSLPERSGLPSDINENLSGELYST